MGMILLNSSETNRKGCTQTAPLWRVALHNRHHRPESSGLIGSLTMEDGLQLKAPSRRNQANDSLWDHSQAPMVDITNTCPPMPSQIALTSNMYLHSWGRRMRLAL